MIRTLFIRLLFLLVGALGGVAAIAQVPANPATPHKGHIFGIVQDTTTNQVVEFANVALFDPVTNKPVDGTMCDEKGKFSLTKVPPGTYNVVVSFIGLETRTFRNIKISEKKTDVDLGNIHVGPVAKLLKEVTVEGQRTLVEEKVDRTVYNAELDKTTAGGDATDVLKRVPMLSVDMDGNVSLRGSQNIKVLINNKPSTITANSVADALKQIPADQIKTVEVITSPSAKYDAEGSAGIINIVTKKNTMQGATLNVDGSSGYRGTNLGLNGAYRKGKMGFTLGGFGRAGYNINGSFKNDQTTTDTAGIHQTFQQAGTRQQNLGGNYTLGWDYDIDKTNSVTASARLGARDNYSWQDNLQTQTYTNGNKTSNLLQNVKTTDLSNTLDLNLNYTHSFAKPQREFNFLTLYSRNNRTNNFVRSNLDTLSQAILSRTRNDNTSYNQEITLQADYQTPIGDKQLVEMGGKEIMRKVSSDYQYFTATGAEGAYTPSAFPPPNLFSYHQNISAGYTSYTLSMPAGYSLKAGVRYEYTTINANFQNTSDIPTNIPSYGVTVPSINVSKKLKSGGTLKAAFNRRIQRPSIQYLNPNIQSSNPFSITQGNPNLRPEYTNNYEIGYSTFIKNTSLNFNTFMRNTTGSIQSVKEPKGNAIWTTYENIGKEDAYGFSFFANVNISNKLTLNGGTDVYYAVLNNNIAGPYNSSNQGWVYNMRAFGNYTLGQGWGLQFFGFYRGRQVLLQGTQGGFGVYSMSIRKDLPNKKGSIGIGADNFFTPAIYVRSHTEQPGLIDQHSTNAIHNMNFKISFSYRLGKMSFDAPRKRRKMINNDDMKEGGDNNPANATQQQSVGQQGGGGQGGQGGQSGPPANAGQGRKGVQGQGQGTGNWQKQNPPKRDSLKMNPSTHDTLRQDSLKQDTLKPGTFKQDTLKQDSIKRDTLRQDSTRRSRPNRP